MKNFVQEGRALELIAPAGGVTAGVGVLVGSIFVVAAITAPAGAAFNGDTFGVFDLAKATGQAWTQGVKVYWDNAAKNVTTTAAGNTPVGYAAAAQLAGDTVGRVFIPGGMA